MTGDRWLRDPATFQGRVEMRPFASAALKGNPLGDPSEREVPVYVPPVEGDLPVVFLLTGFTGRPHKLLDTHPWSSSVVLDLDRAMSAGEMPACVLVMPDCFTRFGGSQYVNSTAVGRYEDYVCDELVPWVDEHYPTSGRRGVMGKSSGGFGALHLAMRRPGVFSAVASIAGDCHFEYGYAADFLPALRGLGAHGGDPRAFLSAFDESHDLSGDGHAVLNTLAMAACYSPNPETELGFDLPFDLGTGARVPEVWERWLAFDPLIACEAHADALRGLSLLRLEAGTRDEFHLQFGLRVLVRRLRELDVPCEHVEFDGGHFGLDRRYLEVLPRVVAAVS